MENRAASLTIVAALILVAASSFSVFAEATTHVVGGSTGWTIPPNSSFYSAWASSQNIAVGDTLGN